MNGQIIEVLDMRLRQVPSKNVGLCYGCHLYENNLPGCSRANNAAVAAGLGRCTNDTNPTVYVKVEDPVLLTEDPDHGDPSVSLTHKPVHGGYPEGPRMPLASDGAKLAGQGARRAALSAENANPGWQQSAYERLERFAAARKAQGVLNLTSEQVRKDAEAGDLPVPPDKRAWGAVMMRASRAGLLVKNGWVNAEDPKVHANPVSLWTIA